MSDGWQRHLGGEPDRWWTEGVLYQVYPRSFADANGDGIGDLAGLIDRLDHLAWLGVDGIWLNPTMPSPNRDWGYDVSDYVGVHPDFGSLADMDRLLECAHARGIRVLLDLVPNHTSDQHPWFQDARSGPGARHRDWYVWAPPRPGGGPPNNWRSVFGGLAWEWDAPSGQYYLHNFDVAQPDLNWWHPDVARAFDEILAFWYQRGVDGFRIDVANGIVKDRELRDDPPVTEDDLPILRRHGLRQVYSMNRPETHDVFRGWRRLGDAYRPARVLLGEAHAYAMDELAQYYGAGDELHMAFNFPFVFADFGTGGQRAIVADVERTLPAHAWPVYTGSNHDFGRLATRWCAGDQRLARCALLMLLTLRGTPVLYYGDELGLADVDIPRDRVTDPEGLAGRPTRDRCRTPLRWDLEPGAGFTRPGVEPWLLFDEQPGATVAEQQADPGSTLCLVRKTIELRRRLPALRTGAYAEVDAPPGVWAWRRGEDVTVGLNLTDRELDVPGVTGRVLVSTVHGPSDREAAGSLRLAPFEGAVVRATGPDR